MARILKDFAVLEAYLELCGLGRGGSQHGDLGATGQREHAQSP
jgi:hypothetical protein